VKYGCDRDVWSSGPNGCLQTLLHRSIDDNKEAAAQFLVRRSVGVKGSKLLYSICVQSTDWLLLRFSEAVI
jgi:hypothetical protein